MLSLLIGMLSISTAQAGDDVNWKIRPHVKPILGGTMFSSDGENQYAIKAGGSAGVTYAQKKSGLKWKGLARAQYVQTWAPKVSGKEIRVGPSIGPWWRIVGANVGVDYVVDDYQWEKINVTMPQTHSIAPVIGARADIKLASVSLKAGPSFFVKGDRKSVNWDTTDFPGFGDEFFWSAQAHVGLGPFGIGAGVTKKYTAYGNEIVGGLGLSLF